MKTIYISAMHEFPSRVAHTIQIMNTSSALASHGMDLELVVPQRETPLEELIYSNAPGTVWEFYGVPRNFEINYMPVPLFGSKIGYGLYVLSALTLAGLKGKQLYYFRQMEPAYLAGLAGKVTVFESHNHVRNTAKRLMPRWARLMQDPRRRIAMVVTSRTGADGYAEWGIPRERILVAPNGVNVSRFSSGISKAAARIALGLSPTETIVGFSGHLYENFGIDELMNAAQLLPEVSFLVVGGDPPAVEKYQNQARHGGMSNVTFVGFVPPERVATYLLAADILVMAYTTRIRTRDNMCPMKMFDYLASGRPMVATDFPILHEVLRDRHNAVMVPPDSGAAIANGIRWLLEHPQEATQIGEQAQLDAQQYSWENRGRRIVSWLKDLFEIS